MHVLIFSFFNDSAFFMEMICIRVKKPVSTFDKRLSLDQLAGKPESRVLVKHFRFPRPTHPAGTTFTWPRWVVNFTSDVNSPGMDVWVGG